MTSGRAAGGRGHLPVGVVRAGRAQVCDRHLNRLGRLVPDPVALLAADVGLAWPEGLDLAGVVVDGERARQDGDGVDARVAVPAAVATRLVYLAEDVDVARARHGKSQGTG